MKKVKLSVGDECSCFDPKSPKTLIPKSLKISTTEMMWWESGCFSFKGDGHSSVLTILQQEFATTSSESGDSQLSGDTTLLLDEVRSVLEDSLSKTTMTAFQQLWNLDCKPSPPTKLVAKTAHSVTFSLADLESGTDSDSEFESVMLSSHRQFTMENKPIWMDTKMTEVLFWDTVKECKKALDVSSTSSFTLQLRPI